MVLTFDKKYELLKEYLSFHDRKYPVRKAYIGDFNIYKWVKNLKKIYFEGERDSKGNIFYDDITLSKNQIDMLDDLNFPWGLNSKNTFNSNFRYLKEYLNTHDNQYPTSKTYYNGIYITEWMKVIRNAVIKGTKLNDGSYKHESKQFILTKNQYDKLVSIGFDFNIKQTNKVVTKPQVEPSNEFFNDGYLLLLEYIKKYKKYPTTTTFFKGENLGYFITKLRKIAKYGEKQENGDIVYMLSKLTKENLNQLNEIGFPYESENYLDKWFRNYNALVDYLGSHNGEFPTGMVPYKYESLKTWILNQRIIFNNGVEKENGTLKFQSSILHKDQIELLNTLNFPWVGNKTKYLKRKINTTQEMINKRRYLVNQLERISDKEVFNSKEDIDKFTKKYIKSIYKKQS